MILSSYGNDYNVYILLSLICIFKRWFSYKIVLLQDKILFLLPLPMGTKKKKKLTKFGVKSNFKKNVFINW